MSRRLLFDREDIQLYWFPYDGFELSVRVDGQLLKKRYVGYTVEEAEKLFLEEFNRA